MTVVVVASVPGLGGTLCMTVTLAGIIVSRYVNRWGAIYDVCADVTHCGGRRRLYKGLLPGERRYRRYDLSLYMLPDDLT